MQLDAFFPFKLAVTADTFNRSLLAVLREQFGLSREEWRLLFLLEGAGRANSLDLAKRTNLDKVQVSRAAQRLEEKGLITRSVPDEDKRLREYAITVIGRNLFHHVFAEVEARVTKVLAAMREQDKQALERGLTALLAAVNDVEGKEPDAILA